MHFRYAVVLFHLGCVELASAQRPSSTDEPGIDLSVPLETQQRRLSEAQRHSFKEGPYGTRAHEDGRSAGHEWVEDFKRGIGHKMYDRSVNRLKDRYANQRDKKNAKQHEMLNEYYKTGGESPLLDPKRMREMQELSDEAPTPFGPEEKDKALQRLNQAHKDEQLELGRKHFSQSFEGATPKAQRKVSRIRGMVPRIKSDSAIFSERERSQLHKQQADQVKLFHTQGEEALPLKLRQQMHLGPRNEKQFRENTYTAPLPWSDWVVYGPHIFRKYGPGGLDPK